jgi:uroporphyrinogen-III decarboxylase
MRIAMSMGIPDRVPVMCQSSWGHILVNSGIKPVDFLFTPDGFADGIILMQKRYAFDGIVLNLYSTVDPDLFRRARVSEAKDGQTIEFPDGRIFMCPWDDDCFRIDGTETLPAFESTEVDEIPESMEIPSWRFETTRIVKAEVGKSISVHGSVGSPFDRFVFHFGLEQALVALIESPEKSLQILLRFADQQYFFAKAQVDLGVDAVSISSPFAGSRFISKGMYQRFVVPAESRLTNRLRAYSHDTPVYIHTCGNINDRLELMASAGVQGIECLDPPPLGDTILADAKKRVGHKIFLKGSLDSVNVLLRCSRDELQPYVLSMLKEGAPGGGFILSTACSIAPHVKPWVLESLTPLCEEFGLYDSTGSLPWLSSQ